MQSDGVFAMDSDDVGRASEAVCSRSGLTIISSHGVGLESVPLSPVPLPLSDVVVGIVASLAGSALDSVFSLSACTRPECASRRVLAWGAHPRT